MKRSRRTVLAVASGGGHWVQLRRVAAAFDGREVCWATTRRGYRAEVGDDRFFVVRDANLDTKLGLALLAIQMFWLVLRLRPSAVVSTGAAPGYFALRFGKWFGARTVWIDSIANVEQLSVSGAKIQRHADLWLTQWPHLAAEGKEPKPHFAGAVV